jgi:hypothetical protein
VEEHPCHPNGHTPPVSGQPMSNLTPCQEAQGRYGALEVTQKV